MDQAAATEHAKVGKDILGWFIGFGVSLLLYGILSWFDSTTELTPGHDNVLQACFTIAGLGGLASGVLVFHKSKGIAAWRRAGLR